MPVYGSKWDLRQPWQVEDLKKKIKSLLTKRGKSTREIAEAAECSHEQARRLLHKLWNAGHVVPVGDKRQRTWEKA